MKALKIFRNKPSPHYEDWIILEDNEIPTLEQIKKEMENG